jgi:hypothetical protein
VILVATVLCTAVSSAEAQVPVGDRPAISVERFTPAPGRGGFGVVEDPDVLPRWRWAAALWSSIMGRPIVFRDVMTGEEATVPVAWRLGFEASGAIGLGTRYQVGVAIPWAAQDGDRLQGTGIDAAPLQRLVLGDLRLHGKARIAGAPGQRGMAAGLAGGLTLPTGDDGDFAGEAGLVVDWRLLIGWRGRRAAVAGNLGVRFRSQEVVLLSPARPHGNELTTGLAGEVRLPDVGVRSSAIGEAVWVIGDSIDAGARGASPGELRGGVRLDVAEGWAVTLLGGAGITPDDVGSPAWRLALGVVHDRAPIADRDGDGIRDAADHCSRAPEDVDGHADDDGCPDPDDDGDGILDGGDRCPRDAEDLDGHADADGCPDTETLVPPMPDPTAVPPPLPEWLTTVRAGQGDAVVPPEPVPGGP